MSHGSLALFNVYAVTNRIPSFLMFITAFNISVNMLSVPRAIPHSDGKVFVSEFL